MAVIADEQLADSEILRLLQKWIQEDKLAFLVQVVNRNQKNIGMRIKRSCEKG